MKFTQKYIYPTLERVTQANGTRHYTCPETGRALASVTTILDQTSDKSGLLEWRKRVGDKEADRIKHEAVGLGSLVHEHLENFIIGKPRPKGNNLVRLQAEAMADQVIEHGLKKNVVEVWGTEVAVYSPGLYAGTIDGVGLVVLPDGDIVEAIFDFKTARKMKKKDHIYNYFQQTCAYAVANNELHNTKINTTVIFMVDRDFNYQQFIITGAEFNFFRDQWFSSLERYVTSVSSLATMP